MPTITVKNHRIVYTIAAVTINNDSSVTSYDKDTDGLAEIQRAVTNAGNWGVTFSVNERGHTIERVTALVYPSVDGHPGHTHDSTSGAWKYNVERGNGSVDRYVLDTWRATVTEQSYANVSVSKSVTVDQITARITITCNARVLVNTH